MCITCISIPNIHDRLLIIPRLCVGGGAAAGWYFTPEEAGLIIRFHCRPFLVPQAAVKVVLLKAGSSGSPWVVAGQWGKATVTAGGTTDYRGGRVNGINIQWTYHWTLAAMVWERTWKLQKKTFSTCVLVKELSGLNSCLISVVVFVSTNLFWRSVHLDQYSPLLRLFIVPSHSEKNSYELHLVLDTITRRLCLFFDPLSRVISATLMRCGHPSFLRNYLPSVSQHSRL